MEQQPTYETATTRVWYVRTGASSGGEVHEQVVEYAPGSPFPPAHYHPAQDEHFEVREGRMLFVVDGREHEVGAGDSIDIARGTPHQARNASSSVSAVVNWQTRPALRTTEFFLTAAALGDRPDLLSSAVLAHEFREVFRLAGPTAFVLPAVAAAGRLLGRRLPPVTER